MATLLLVVPKRSTEKHPSNPLATEQRFLNFGVLSLATYAKRLGHRVAIFDEYSSGKLKDVIPQLDKDARPDVIGISCISAYCAERAKEVAGMFRAQFPRATIVIGGQHFAGSWGKDFNSYVSEADALVGGEGEIALARILALCSAGQKPQDWNALELPENVWWRSAAEIKRGYQPYAAIELDDIVIPECETYPGYDGLFPSIEFSRGCRYACTFCANSNENRKHYRRASTDRLAQAIKAVASRTKQQGTFCFYMQSSEFFVTETEAEELATAFAEIPYNLRWRTEVRADRLDTVALRNLKSAGLSYLDIGLESACPGTLKFMNKTGDPSVYLERASELLAEATRLEIFTKVNFLIHPGDTPSTVEESLGWLLSQKQYINAVSSGIALEFPFTPLTRNLAIFAGRFGAKRRQHDLSRWGVYNIDPSESLTFEEGEILALKISQQMQTREEFARSKAFGYMPLGFNADNYEAWLPPSNRFTPYR